MLILISQLTLPPSSAQEIGSVSRIVEKRGREVGMTTRAAIWREGVKIDVENNSNLFEQDTLQLFESVWLELLIDRDNVKGRIVLAENGLYAVKEIDPLGRIHFLIERGKLFLDLKLGEIIATLGSVDVAVHSTEILFSYQTPFYEPLLYLREGRISFPQYSEEMFTGIDNGWTISQDQTPLLFNSGNNFTTLRDDADFLDEQVWARRSIGGWTLIAGGIIASGVAVTTLGGGDGDGPCCGTTDIDIVVKIPK